jgi:hypothetical protein
MSVSSETFAQFLSYRIDLDSTIKYYSVGLIEE